VIVFDHRRSGKHKIIGEFETTVRLLVQAKENGGDVDEDNAFTLRKRGEKKVGHVLVLKAQIVGSMAMEMSRQPAVGGHMLIPQLRPSRRPEFVDYLAGGCQISLAVAIDFTASNGKWAFYGILC
jgi:TPP-dependent indolepyruvate ferredoxin oxidoreductase alpha subunit